MEQSYYVFDAVATWIRVSKQSSAKHAENAVNADCISGFLHDLAEDGLLRAFAQFNSTSGKTPRLSRRLLLKQQFAFMVVNHSCNGRTQNQIASNLLSQPTHVAFVIDLQ
ncbi:hypothetical protein WJ07_16940 [Burkholderia vietnamiensis]|nr:hypothetical protein WJ07_16940 [Burkholderia vietnamiensis]